jgi:hypothetical protein
MLARRPAALELVTPAPGNAARERTGSQPLASHPPDRKEALCLHPSLSQPTRFTLPA